jgi:hypothetical protein
LISTGKSEDRIAGTNKVEALQKFGIIELFLKCQSGTGEPGDEDNGRFGRVASSMSPNSGTVLGLNKLSEGWHDEDVVGG